MQCFELLDDAKKNIFVDLTNKNPHYAVIPFTLKNRPSTNKLWDRMGQMVVKASGEWVRLDVEVDGKGRTKMMYMCACIKPTSLSIYVYNSRDGTSLMSGHTCLRATVAASSSNSLVVWASKHDMPTDSAKANMTNSLVNMCSWDIHPFSSMEGACFKNVIQITLDIGFASKTPLLAEDLLRSRQTVKCNTMVRFDKSVLKLQVILHKHFIENGVVLHSPPTFGRTTPHKRRIVLTPYT
jgi:hypothetical protein